ncbi:MAG: zinc ABC transporter substrate-binding protein [Verrucomicrobia bacterium]|nr:MAG: zinc ABC transporter substrate-binding protein [Verrucomicrobiota bacterium]
MLTRKQRIYCDILEQLLPFMRNIQTHSAWHRFRYGSFYPEMELVHNMHRILVLPEFTEYDVHWLNAQARLFVERGNNPLHGFYESITASIIELFTLVPEPLRNKLTWPGPAQKLNGSH